MNVIREHFERHAQQFDQLYVGKSRLRMLVNRWIRPPFYRRFGLTMTACGEPRGKRVLDVGCGSGRYSVALAEKGADVVGIDLAQNMLALAQEHAREKGVLDRCHFIQADFLELDLVETFDISLAIGLFDYVQDPFPILRRMRELTTGRVIVSFPRPNGWRSTQRRLRYRIQRCPLYFHSQETMADHFAAAGYASWQFSGSWAVAFPLDAADHVRLGREENTNA